MTQALPWFRLYSNLIVDPAIEFLSFEDQRHFIWLLCLKNEGFLDQAFEAPIREKMIARKLGLQGEALATAKQRLVEMKLIDADWQPVAWDRLQVPSDSSSERTRRYRQKRGLGGGVSETPPSNTSLQPDPSQIGGEPPQIGGVSNQKRHDTVTVTPQIRKEKKREDRKPPPSEVAAASPSEKPKQRAMRLIDEGRPDGVKAELWQQLFLNRRAKRIFRGWDSLTQRMVSNQARLAESLRSSGYDLNGVLEWAVNEKDWGSVPSTDWKIPERYLATDQRYVL